MRSNIWVFFIGLVALAGTAAADPRVPAGNEPLNARPWVERWTDEHADVVRKICQAGRVEPSQQAALSSCLADNKAALDGVVARSREAALPVLEAEPHSRLIVDIGNLLTARGVAGASRDPEAAIDDWLAALRLAQSATLGPQKRAVLIDAMIGLAIQRYPVERMATLTREKKMTGAQARRVVAALERRRKDGVPTIAEIVDHECGFARERLETMTEARAREELVKPLQLDPKTPLGPLVAQVRKLAAPVAARLKTDGLAFAATGKQPAVLTKHPSLEDKLVAMALPNYPAAIKRLSDRRSEVDALEKLCAAIAGN